MASPSPISPGTAVSPAPSTPTSSTSTNTTIARRASSSTVATTNMDAEESLARKRARDRKSQRAMRERQRAQVGQLSALLAVSQAEIAGLQAERVGLQHELASSRVQLEMRTSEMVQERQQLLHVLEKLREECESLKVREAALQLRLLGGGGDSDGPDSVSNQSSVAGGNSSTRAGEGFIITGENPSALTLELHPWDAVPANTTPVTMSDQILQMFIHARSASSPIFPSTAADDGPAFPDKPDLSALFDARPERRVDDTSAVVGDIVRSYIEIDTLPKQVAVHYVMSTLLKWLVLRNKQAYEQMPEWLRPEPAQLQIPHPAWIDRIPWPKVRTYLIEHQDIGFEEFAGAYSSNFTIHWNYDPAHVIISPCPPKMLAEQQQMADGNLASRVLINPIYEEHLRQLRNWTVGDKFRRRFPTIAEIVDSYV